MILGTLLGGAVVIGVVTYWFWPTDQSVDMQSGARETAVVDSGPGEVDAPARIGLEDAGVGTPDAATMAAETTTGSARGPIATPRTTRTMRPPVHGQRSSGNTGPSVEAASPGDPGVIPTGTRGLDNDAGVPETPVPEPPRPEVETPDELDLFKRATAAARRGDTSRALQLLDHYDEVFPLGDLAESMALLRIEIHCSTGERERVDALARAFRQRYPDSVHSRRLASVCNHTSSR